MALTIRARGAVIALLLVVVGPAAPAQSELCTIDPATGRASVPADWLWPTELHCPCPGSPMFVVNNDRSYEAALMWRGDGVVGAEAGALAEPFTTPEGQAGAVCFMPIWLFGTTSAPASLDLIVWSDDEGQPGEVLGVVPGVDVGTIAPWPLGAQRNIDFDIEAEIVPVEGPFWAGVRPVSGSDSCAVLLGADANGPDRNAMTYVAPGLGLPEGWQTLESVYGQSLSLAIGIVVGNCVSPTLESSWSRIKALYR